MDLFSGKSPHRPLSTIEPSEIRIIKLFPANFDDEIRCELEHMSLEAEDCMPYAAVSYYWGDPRGTNTILLDGQPYPVSANLYAFLQHAQSIFLAIYKFLPAILQQGRQECDLITQLIVYSILEDFDFPLDFPSTSDSTLRDLVQRHVEKVAVEGCKSAGRTQLDLVLDLLQNTDDLHEPGDCYLRLWIDALCINQQDLNERNQQVSRMRNIYGCSQSLLIWPQDTTTPVPGARVVAEFVRDLHTAIRPHLADIISWGDVVCNITSDSFLAPRLDAIDRLRQIIRQNWFSRMWIIQEVAAAAGPATVLLGFFPIPWRFLTHIVFACCEEMTSHEPALQIMFRGDAKQLSTLRLLESEYKELRRRSELNQQIRLPIEVPERLKQLLQQTGGRFQATEPHDYLYAVLGLLGSDDIPEEIFPDYSMPFEQVYHQYTIYIIINTGDISFFLSHRRELTGVPSWVPD